MVSIPNTRIRGAGRILLGFALLITTTPIFAAPPSKTHDPNTKSDKSDVKQTSLPALLMYRFEVGRTYHYKVVAYLSGQIPKLSAPGEDARCKIELYYAATVQKQEAKGTTVAFSIEKEEVSLLAKDPGPDGKISPDDVLPFPLPKEQVQSFLNVTALLRPDGSIADVTGGSNDPIKINIGFDLRKLFVLMLPVVFPQTSVCKGSNWPFDEGMLGRKQGTTYTGHLMDIRTNPKHVTFQVTQDAQALISDKLDSEGNSTNDPKQQVGLLTGKVTAVSSMDFVTGPPNLSGKVLGQTTVYFGLLSTGKMTLNVDLKRELPDPDHPDQKQVAPILVRGRMEVTMQDGPPKDDAEAPASVSKTTGPASK